MNLALVTRKASIVLATVLAVGLMAAAPAQAACGANSGAVIVVGNDSASINIIEVSCDTAATAVTVGNKSGVLNIAGLAEKTVLYGGVDGNRSAALNIAIATKKANLSTTVIGNDSFGANTVLGGGGNYTVYVEGNRSVGVNYSNNL